MESPQSVVSPFKTSSIYSDPKNHNLAHFVRDPSSAPKKTDSYLGVLEVYIHEARDIQNICIYHKQDVYAKISLTNNPEKTAITQTVNGGGINPVFNENLCIDIPDVATINASLKCEIYMMSRAKNYLEDQLLGFALVPLSDIIVENGKLNKEFTLSSSDVFHSPSGFVELTLSYNGVSPDVIAISRPVPPSNTNVSIVSDQCELDKLEFPDPKIVNENEMMVSEYIGICSESLGSSDTDDQASSENGTSVFDNHKPDSPPTSVSTNGSQCPSAPTASSESADQESDSPPKEKPAVSDSVDKLKVNTGLVEKVIQQDFVDLYMKSMQQFTESLAKMNLPVDMESEQTSSGNSRSDQTTQTPNGNRPRVFYGSRAFF
ncbi:C2 calcium-dependent membrane-targeting protein [Tanacetum coccineum]